MGMTSAPSDLSALFAAIDGTWPALRTQRTGPFTVRDGDGGGQRVSATTLDAAEATPDQIAAVEAQMSTPLFSLRTGQDVFDAQLQALGYRVKDITNLYTIAPNALTDRAIPRVTTFEIWEPLQIMRDIWDEGGIGPARLRVMDRVTGPKTAILGRIDDQPGATAFVAMHEGIAMLHALEVRTAHRRKGLAGWVMRQAAFWAERQGAETLAILVTQANTGANALYQALGMTQVGQYHYRIKEPQI